MRATDSNLHVRVRFHNTHLQTGKEAHHDAAHSVWIARRCSVDNLGGGSDYTHIDVSQFVLCYCTEQWFTNEPCIREIVRAILRKKPIIALLEPYTSEQHGGLTEADIRAILGDEKKLNGPGGMKLYSERLQDLKTEVSEWSKAWPADMEPPIQLPTAAQVKEALFKSAPIIWSPLSDFQDVSIRMIAERMLPEFKHTYASTYKQRAYIQGEKGQERLSVSRYWSWPWSSSHSGQGANTSPRLSGARRFDLYVSENEPRAHTRSPERLITC